MLSKLFFVFAVLAIVDAHIYLSSIIINGQAQAIGDCLRPKYSGSSPNIYANSPIQDKTVLTSGLTGANMTCGFLPYAANPANRKCAVPAGARVGLQWYHNTASASDDIMDTSHKGPIMVYMAKSSTGSGNVWFKIYEDGFNFSTNKWATEVLIANRGLVTITIPSDISPGDYLLRGEMIAHHESYALNGAQPYVACAELTISGSGTANPAGVAFPGAYSPNDPGILFNIYNAFTSYTIPGPAVYRSGSTTPGTTPTTPGSTPTTPGSTPPGGCSVGADGCPCTAGGSCDAGLKCIAISAGNYCVAGSASSIAISSLLIIAGLFIALN